LAKELVDYQEELQRMRKAVSQLAKERERLGNDLGEQKINYQAATEELKMRETQLDELRKRIIQWETKLRQQQQLYEAVRSDRNHYSKGLIEAQDEIAELRKKFKIMGHQIEQLKEEIVAKDQVWFIY
jgi:chromosome segregation ATPase